MFDWLSLHLLAVVSTALLAGGMLFFSFIFAPLVFRTLDPENAGTLIRAVFPVYYLAGFLIAVLGAIFAWPASAADGALLGAVALVFALARQVLRPAIDAQRARRSLDPSAAAIFRRLHGVSMVLNLLQMIAVLVVLVRLSG